jgi:putative cardiolipin synthase
MRFCKLSRAYLLLLMVMTFIGCASVPKEIQRTPSKAFPDHTSTELGAYFDQAAARHPGQSGFVIIPDGHNAFTTRIAMTELAVKALDLQYFIWEADATGKLLAERLVRSAERGVRVRILLDDLDLENRDKMLAALDAHPNIEIRIFNPFAHRANHLLDVFTNFERVNHRMHNKLFVMDNAVAIVGGRNIGDQYFEVNQQVNFRDMDVVAGGPVVREASRIFDHFWNSSWAVPVRAEVDRVFTKDDLHKAVEALQESIAKEPFPYPYPLNKDVASMKAHLGSLLESFIWAPGQMVFDDPDEINTYGRTKTMTEEFYRHTESLKSELLIEVPYHVLRERGVATAKRLREQGVRIRLLTNSLASNDMLAAHAGHAERRKELVAAGVELYEFRADPPVKKRTIYLSGPSRATLHNKVMVFDRETVFIGSFNLDPRSEDINTEAGLYIKSPELAARMVAHMDEGVLPRNSFRVLLDNDGDLYWSADVDGKVERFDYDPDSTVWQRVKVRMIRMLPVMNQL